jgi:outer membrane protein insertion porin family
MGTSARAERLPDSRVHRIEIHVDGDTDIPRVLDLLGVQEGDVYSDADLDRGLVRLAGSEKFLGVAGGFRVEDGVLLLKLSLVPRIESVEVRFTGLEGKGKAVTEARESLESDLLEVTGLSPGDAIFTDQIRSIRERVLNRLRERGYSSAQALVTLEERVLGGDRRLVVTARPGPRTQLTELRLRGFSRADAQNFLGRLENAKPSTPRDAGSGEWTVGVSMPADSIYLSEVIRQWQDESRAAGYYDFQLKVSPLASPRMDALSVDLARGPRFNLQFHNVVAFWERDLREMVLSRPQRLGVPISIREAEALILQEYRKAGYVQASVKTRIDEGEGLRTLHFDVQEGRRFILGKFRFIGATPDQEGLFQKAVADWLRDSQSPLHRLPYDERFLRAELPALQARLRTLGYLEARILEMRPQLNPASALVNIDLPVQPGDRYHVRNVEVAGNISLSQRELDRLVDIDPGEPVNPAKVYAVRDRLLKKYRDLGFLEVSIPEDEGSLLHLDVESSQADIIFEVQQGPVVRVGTAVVTGLKKTKEKVVLRELSKDALAPGGFWTPSGADRLEQRLLNTSIFGSVQFEPVGGRILKKNTARGDEIEVHEKDLKIALTERPSGSFEFGPGYRTDKGIIGFAEFNYRNLGGWNRSLQVKTRGSRRLGDYHFVEQTHSFTYLEPWLLNQRVRLRFNTQFRKEDKTVFDTAGKYTGYYNREVEFSFSTETKLSRYVSWVQNLYTLSLPQITFPGQEFTRIDRQASTETKYRIGTIGTTITFDNRDNFFNPRHGWLLSSAVEYASPKLVSQDDVNFISFRQDATTYLPISAGSEFAFSAIYRRLWGLGESNSIPLTKRFSIGGYHSVRSLPDDFLRFDGPSVRDQEAIEGKVEYRQGVSGDLGVAYFWDVGRLNAVGGLTTKWRNALGVGLRYKLLIGPITFDFAYNADRREGEDAYKLQLSLGAF